MTGWGSRSNQYIVHVDQNFCTKKMMLVDRSLEYLIHHALERGRRIRKAEEQRVRDE